ncbi:MAG TPA: glycoside hydrolase family 43 protein [Pedobacter sp.]|nr:glycoside hydrolase family 43 protein [Pedobacter sp.]
MKRLKFTSVQFYVLLALICFLHLQCGKSKTQPSLPENPGNADTFVNPLQSGADPWVYYKEGFYYYLQTTGNNIRIWKTDAMSKLGSATSQLVFSPVPGTANSRNIWAPEIHYLDHKWYIYYTAGNGDDLSQRTWVLENSSPDPTLGTWTEKGRIFSSNTDFWAIDGTVMQYNGIHYFLWSGRPDPANTNLTQNLYISKMVNPWTLEPQATMISSPQYAWEKNGFGVNEAPESLQGPSGRQFLIYSASFCGTDDYALGMLTLKASGNPMVSSDWEKNPQPVLTKQPQNKAFGPGHCAFFTSPDGKETWLIYHANSNSGEGCAEMRNIRIQQFTFNPSGFPVFQEPVASGLKVKRPSGER